MKRSLSNCSVRRLQVKLQVVLPVVTGTFHLISLRLLTVKGANKCRALYPSSGSASAGVQQSGAEVMKVGASELIVSDLSSPVISECVFDTLRHI